MIWVLLLALVFVEEEPDPGNETESETYFETEIPTTMGPTEAPVVEVTLNESAPTEVASTDIPVMFSGRGSIIPQQGAPNISIGTAILTEGTDLVATGLVITENLALALRTKLSADEGQAISVGPALAIQVLGEINFDNISQSRFPFIDLGEVGENYDEVPSLIGVRARISGTDLDAEQHLIRARNLTNCEEWRAVVSFPTNIGLRARCVRVSEGETALAIVLADDVPEPTRKIVMGVIGGMAAGCAAVVVLVVIGIFATCARVLRLSTESSYSTDMSDSPSSSF